MGDKGEVYFILFSTPESKIFSTIQKRAYLLKAEIYYVYNNPSKNISEQHSKKEPTF